MSTTTIREILADRPLHSVGVDATLRDVSRLMARHGVGAVVVQDGGALQGVLSERDIVFRAVAKGLSVETARAADVMTSNPVTVDVGAGLADTLRAHLGSAFRHMPVMDGDRVVGLLSYRDVPAEYVMLYERFLEMSGARADG